MSDTPAAPPLSTLPPEVRFRAALMHAALAANWSALGMPVAPEDAARLSDEFRRGVSELGHEEARRFVLAFVTAWPTATGLCAICGGLAHPGEPFPCPNAPPEDAAAPYSSGG